MSTFQILCVTMNQSDFSKIDSMNIHSDVIFANQGEINDDQSFEFENHHARMISTKTKGVGINRNISLAYASADICLLADDDITYTDDLEKKIISEFDEHPDADIVFFHLVSTDKTRSVKKPDQTKKLHRLSRIPWGGAHVAFRLSSARKANLWFTTLFGGGCIYPNGEDSIWLTEARRKGLTFYASKETIGQVDMSSSSWYSGADEKYYYGRGALYAHLKKKPMFAWMLYFAYRTQNRTKLTFTERIKWMKHGINGYRTLTPFDEYKA